MEVVLSTKCCTQDMCEHVIHTLVAWYTHAQPKAHPQPPFLCPWEALSETTGENAQFQLWGKLEPIFVPSPCLVGGEEWGSATGWSSAGPGMVNVQAGS